eukprot:scaffold105803_cov15-Phaeocystis_antarctica.AAC.1
MHFQVKLVCEATASSGGVYYPPFDSACMSNSGASGVCLVPLTAAECPVSTTPALTEAARG